METKQKNIIKNKKGILGLTGAPTGGPGL